MKPDRCRFFAFSERFAFWCPASAASHTFAFWEWVAGGLRKEGGREVATEAKTVNQPFSLTALIYAPPNPHLSPSVPISIIIILITVGIDGPGHLDQSQSGDDFGGMTVGLRDNSDTVGYLRPNYSSVTGNPASQWALSHLSKCTSMTMCYLRLSPKTKKISHSSKMKS